MQTFLPYPDFIESAEVLDKKRCWKQVVEAKQIISALSHIQECPKDKIPWSNHPAVRMWEGHIPELKAYFNCFLSVVINKHKVKTNYQLFYDFSPRLRVHDSYVLEMPWWLGNPDFHRAMRARLIEKNEEFYLPKFPKDKGFNSGKYLWPVMDGSKTFKII